VCPRSGCGGHGTDVFRIGGEKHSHRDGLHLCKKCRKQFSVTVGTPLERLRIPLSTWVRAAHAFSYQAPKGRRSDNRDEKPTLSDIQVELGVNYRTVLRMRNVIKQAAGKYRGHKSMFGAWPRSFMLHQRVNPEKTIKPTGVLAAAVPARTYSKGELNRTEQLLRLLLASPKPPRKRRASSSEKYVLRH
jgi:transposase-like protein